MTYLIAAGIIGLAGLAAAAFLAPGNPGEPGTERYNRDRVLINSIPARLNGTFKGDE